MGSVPRSTSGMGRPCAPGKLHREIDAQPFINGRGDLRRCHRTIAGRGADFVRRSDDCAALQRVRRPSAWSSIAANGRARRRD